MREPWAHAVIAGATVIAGALWTVTGRAAEWHPEAGYRWAPLPAVQGAAAAGFERIPAERSGLRFTNPLSELAGAGNRVLYNGSGVAAGDFDGDGQPDLFFCSLTGSNALYRNLGAWRFEDVTASAGLSEPMPETRGALFADVNADHRLDLLISVNGRGVLCYFNAGDGRFTNATTFAGTSNRLGSTTLAMADVDGNGTPDLYVANYRTEDIRDRGRVHLTMVQGRPMLRGSETNRFLLVNGKLEETGQPDQLYLNDGSGRFSAVSWTDGAFLDEAGQPLREAPLDWGLTAAFHDLNADGAPDLYVCNDFWTPDRLWFNDGTGRFRAAALDGWRKMPASSMGVDFADVDLDGDTDFFVVDMLSRDPRLRKRQLMAHVPSAAAPGIPEDRQQVPRNTLFLNRGDGTFAEAAYQAGLEASEWSWSPVFLDVDLDGDSDVLVASGHFRDVQDFDAERTIQSRQRKWDGFPSEAARQAAYTRELAEHHRLYPLLQLPLLGFRNEGDGRFIEATESWSLIHPGVHQGLALADLDGDGGLDVVMNSLQAGAAVYRMTTPAQRMMVRLRGRAPNTQALGAVVSLKGGDARVQSREWSAGGRYLSGSDPCAMFAMPPGISNLVLEVRWRSGQRSRIEGVTAGRVYEVDETSSTPVAAEPVTRTPTLFQEVGIKSAPIHVGDARDEFAQQPLLPWMPGRMGPGMLWVDWDGDGREDLVQSAGAKGGAVVLTQNAQGHFVSGPMVTPGDGGDVLGVWSMPSGVLMARLAGDEGSGVVATKLSGGQPGLWTGITPGMTRASSVAAGVPARDGRLALFVGGGVVSGRYPLGAASRLLWDQGGSWVLDARNSVLLENLGIVNGAVWSDLDGDGDTELVLACEWGPVRGFDFRGGRLVEVTQLLGLSEYTGWWRAVSAGDFDGDGRMDLVASNFGRNSPYRGTRERPLVFAYGELAQPGVMEVLETEYAGDALVPRLQMAALAPSLPFLLERFHDQKSYSLAGLDDVLGERAPLSRRVQATTLDSMVFLNRTNGFAAVPLPAVVQRAPAFGLAVADFDADGAMDLFVSQNVHTTRREMGRLDAGTGAVLLGNGRGGFHALEPSVSGVRLSGEQRGAAVSDFDHDGRVDFAVGIHGAAARIFRNQSARRGLRVRLDGPPGNPAAVGARVRGRQGNHWGPMHEVRLGGGHLSQDSSTLVLAQPVSHVHVAWPGGGTSVTEVPAAQTEIQIRSADASK